MATSVHARNEFRASPGDRLVIRAHHLGEPDQDAEILQVLGEDGTPPFRVRWENDGREAFFLPGTDAYVERFAPTTEKEES